MIVKLAGFAPGDVFTTPGADQALTVEGLSPAELSTRHLAGDWGDLCDEDKRANDDALKNGDRIFSSYHVGKGVKIWVITEADRSATTLLLPDEY